MKLPFNLLSPLFPPLDLFLDFLDPPFFLLSFSLHSINYRLSLSHILLSLFQLPLHFPQNPLNLLNPPLSLLNPPLHPLSLPLLLPLSVLPPCLQLPEPLTFPLEFCLYFCEVVLKGHKGLFKGAVLIVKRGQHVLDWCWGGVWFQHGLNLVEL